MKKQKSVITKSERKAITKDLYECIHALEEASVNYEFFNDRQKFMIDMVGDALNDAIYEFEV